MKRSLGATTLAYPTPAWIIGTYDDKAKPNAMAVAWGGICCSKPPQITVSLRKATYSYGCILARKAYTVNILPQQYVAEVDYFGIASGRDRDKFEDTGLTPVKSALVDAPYIEEATLVLECRLAQSFDIGLHTMFVGEIIDVKADSEVLDSAGVPDITKVLPILYAPTMRCYYGVGGALGQAYAVGKQFVQKTS